MAADRHVRVRVYGPEEGREETVSFYARDQLKGDAGHYPLNHTAFREAERRFKRRDWSEEEGDCSDILDLQRDAAKDSRCRLLRQVAIPASPCDKEQSVGNLYEVTMGTGGLCFIPGALTVCQQKYWIKQAITRYMAPPNKCTLDAHYEVPPEGLFAAWRLLSQTSERERKQEEDEPTISLTRIDHPDDSAARRALPRQQSFNCSELTALFRRMRWTTLGYHYDWTRKEYDWDQSPAPFPRDLATWCESLCAAAGFGIFVAEAGIVNYYQPGDSLTGHVDRSERTMSVPLVSLSLGASCIFLVGGPRRDDPVLPIRLRSGDILFMSGPSRSYYHGVPRILNPAPELELDSCHKDDPDTRGALEILGSGRLNINIRQVQ